MGLLCQDVPAITVGVRVSSAESGLLVHEPWLSQVPHCHGCLGFPGARGGGRAQILVEVLCSLGSSMVGLRKVACACRSTVGGLLGGMGALPWCPFLGARIPYLFPEDGVHGVCPYCMSA